MRYLITDPSKQDPRALLTAEKLATLADVVAPTPTYLSVSGANTIAVAPDCIITIDGAGVFKTASTALTPANLDTGSNFTPGKNYYVYICDIGGGQDERYVLSLNSTYPSGYSAVNSRKIGGFHYGVCRNVNGKLQPVNTSGAERGANWESNVFSGILPRSVWTLKHRPKCNPEGMVYLGHGTWVDIYLASDDGAGGFSSVHNATPLTGTEGLNQYSFVERALVVGKRLLTYEEFCQMALGSPQGLADANTNAWTATTNTGRQLTGYVQNGVSSIGCRDAVGNVWEWLSTMVTRAEPFSFTGAGTFGGYDGGRAGKEYTDGNGHFVAAPAPNSAQLGRWGWDTFSPLGDGYGNIYEYYDYSLVALLGGGNWNNGIHAGARAVTLYDYPWYVNTNIGSRGACDSL